MRKILAAAALAAAFAAGPAAAQQADAIAVVDAWARATPRVAHMSAAYMTLRNSGAADRLIGVSSPAASAVEMHTVVRDGDVMRMRPVAAIDVAAGGSVELKPGGVHIMLSGR
ncbi:MAG: copper chaperone PCu(A)C, partial [Alphaproteobacteria bacterium]